MIKFLLSLLKAGFAGVAVLLLLVLLAVPAADAVAQEESETTPEFIQSLRTRAEQGDAEAQFNLGVMYRTGEGVARDYSESVKWTRRAAEQGIAEAQYYLGVAYANGQGVAQDDAESVKWWSLAAEQGIADLRAVKQGIAEADAEKAAAGANLFLAKFGQDESQAFQARLARKRKEAAGIADAGRRAMLLSGLDLAEARYNLGVSLLSAAGAGRSDIVATLIAGGADLEARAYFSYTPLHSAAFGGQASVVSLLLAAGAYVNAAKKDGGNTPLHGAAIQGHASIASLLLAAGAWAHARNENGDTPLHLAAFFGYASVVSVLAAAGADVNVRDDSVDDTPLHVAARQDHASVVSVLVAAGADVNATRDGHGSTPLHVAAARGNASIALVLLAAGAYVEATGNYGQTPLHSAAFWDHASVVSVLVAAGADVNATDSDGYTPLDIAKRRKNWDVVALLESHVRVIPQKHGAGIGGAESVFENTWRSVVVVFAGDAQGGGVIVGGPNQVATNCHVVDESPNDIRVYKGAERRAVRDAPYAAEIVAGDRERDVCLLSVAGLWGIAAGVRRAGDLAVGEAVYAVGAPQGLDFSISDGIVSQLRILAGESAPLIQTSAAISPGSSGGGLFDSEGRLVGLTTWKIREGENLNFAVPADWALELQ